MASIILTILGAGLLVPYIILRSKKNLLPGILLKILISALFLLTTLTAAFGHSTWEPIFYNKWLIFGVVAGQIMGLLGDFWLDMKDMYAQHHDVFVFAGFTSFLIGHLFFIVGIFATYSLGPVALPVALGAGAVLGALALLTEKAMKLNYGKFRAIAVGYTAVFGAAIAVALQGYLVTKSTQSLVMTIGLVLFFLSDLVLSGTFFGQGKKRPVDYALNYLLYYGGQFVVALSLLSL
ncbi:MAG: lysoplasmalogenase [Oscillospiraceae bacterium]|jgi:uncharacterized membrane protein YhhN|nr:lysoplasmalogenase [Oscillospiraceae bacterium]